MFSAFDTAKLSCLANYLFYLACVIGYFFYVLQVTIPYGVHREVDTHLLAHLSHKATNRLGSLDDSLHRSSNDGSIPGDKGIFEHVEPMSHNSVVKEKILQRRGLQMRQQQQGWQVSCLSGLNFEVHLICHYSFSCFSNFSLEHVLIL